MELEEIRTTILRYGYDPAFVLANLEKHGVGLQHLSRFFKNFKEVDGTGCWLWFSTIYDGYGYLSIYGHPYRAHRVAHELFIGEIPPSPYCLDHLCRTRRCVNPKHVEIVTVTENNRRGDTGNVTAAMWKAKTHCPQGHPYSGENLLLYKVKHWSGVYRYNRKCRICHKAAMKRHALKVKLA